MQYFNDVQYLFQVRIWLEQQVGRVGPCNGFEVAWICENYEIVKMVKERVLVPLGWYLI